MVASGQSISMAVSVFTRWLPLFAALVFAVGCGGSGGGSGTGTAAPTRSAVRFGVDWPAGGRGDAPAESVLVTVSVDGTPVGTATMNRPQGASAASRTEKTFAEVPAGQLTTSATAYSEADANGSLVGTSETSASLKGGTTLLQTASLATEAAPIEVKTTGVVKGTGNLTVGIG